jgi:hypothetical protein
MAFALSEFPQQNDVNAAIESLAHHARIRHVLKPIGSAEFATRSSLHRSTCLI